MPQLLFCSRNSSYKSPFGAVPCGTIVNFSIFVPFDIVNAAPKFFIRQDARDFEAFDMLATEKRADCTVFSIAYETKKTGIHFYYFDLYVDYKKLYRCKGGDAYICTQEGTLFEQFVYDADFSTPDEFKGGVMYQIFPDRFYEGVKNKEMPFADRVYRENKSGEPYFWPNEIEYGHLNQDYFGGDLVGIAEKLPYIKALGTDIIYLNPIFESHSNHRYNTADYMKIDPLLGSEKDFKRLCDEAKKLGIKIILDGVFSHTGSDSLYFDKEARYGQKGAYHDQNSPYRSWFDFSTKYPHGYRCWWGFESLPEVNESSSSFVQFICGKNGVIDHWLQLGEDGFRLDVADELPDEFIKKIRNAVKRNGSDKLLIGEVWEDAATKESYGARREFLTGKELDSVMNYPFRDAIIEFIKYGFAENSAEMIMSIAENYPPPALNVAMNNLSTHDTVRIITELVGESFEGKDRYWQSGRRLSLDCLYYGKRLLRLAFTMLFTLPGIPCVYYGDEIAMQGYKDPFNRAFFDWSDESKMLRETITQLSALRHSNDVFQNGDISIEKASGDILHYIRKNAKNAVSIVINRGSALYVAKVFGQEVEVAPLSFKAIAHSL